MEGYTRVRVGLRTVSTLVLLNYLVCFVIPVFVWKSACNNMPQYVQCNASEHCDIDAIISFGCSTDSDCLLPLTHRFEFALDDIDCQLLSQSERTFASNRR